MWIVEVYITTWIPTGDQTQFQQPAQDMLKYWRCVSPDSKFRIRYVDSR